MIFLDFEREREREREREKDNYKVNKDNFDYYLTIMPYIYDTFIIIH